MNRRGLLASLFVLALLSGAVVVEAERNYANVTSVEQTDARVANVAADDGALQVRLAVENRMGEPLRLQFVHLEVNRTDHTDAASVPFNGYRTLPAGRATLTVGVPPRQLTGTLGENETVVVGGYVAVEVYNGYRFEVPFGPTEVTL